MRRITLLGGEKRPFRGAVAFEQWHAATRTKSCTTRLEPGEGAVGVRFFGSFPRRREVPALTPKQGVCPHVHQVDPEVRNIDILLVTSSSTLHAFIPSRFCHLLPNACINAAHSISQRKNADQSPNDAKGLP